MSKKVLTMREIKKVIELKFRDDLSQYKIAELTGIPRGTVKDYLRRFQTLNLSWPLPDEMTEVELHDLLFPGNRGKKKNRSEPCWNYIHQELKRKGVTKQLLWQEYMKENRNGYQYSWFADKYQKWAKEHNVWMLQQYKAGENAFVDYSGLTVPIWNKHQTEVLFNAEIFVGVLGASDLIFCHATQDQKLRSWILSHCLMLEYFQGVPELLIPDNLRSGVTKAHRYEPDCNSTYEDFARHYGVNICPARSKKPKDKAKAEKAVQSIQRQILAPKRNHRFTSTEELNEYISAALLQVNNKPLQKLPYCRLELFNKIEKPELRALPEHRYSFAQWFKETVNGSYHVKIFDHHYSIPYGYSHKVIETRVTSSLVECFYKDKRIASHRRDDTPGTCSTLKEHMPEAHRQHAQWSQQNLTSWATNIGNSTGQLIEKVFANKHRHLKQKIRSALGILRLSHAYSDILLESACEQALKIGTCGYRNLKSILQTRLNQPIDKREQLPAIINHENIRGQQDYH
tara:strand:+ start:253 stop:1794 length:1542 start_codon:yes stop_codon:yes gene_type:complete